MKSAAISIFLLLAATVLLLIGSTSASQLSLSDASPSGPIVHDPDLDKLGSSSSDYQKYLAKYKSKSKKKEDHRDQQQWLKTGQVQLIEEKVDQYLSNADHAELEKRFLTVGSYLAK